MKKYKNLREWLESNPPDEEQRVVVNLINQGITHPVRKEIYDLTRYYRKLATYENYLKKNGLSGSEDGQAKMKEIKAQINVLSESLPAITKSAKK